MAAMILSWPPQFGQCSRSGVDLYPFVGQCGSGDGPAQLFQPLALVGVAAHRRMQAKALMVGTQLLGALDVQRHRALHRQNLLPGAWAEGNAVGTRRRLQWTERAGLIRIGVGVGVRQIARSPSSSSTSTLRRVSSFISRVMILCSSACNASSVGESAWTNTGPLSVRRYTPSSTRQWR